MFIGPLLDAFKEKIVINKRKELYQIRMRLQRVKNRNGWIHRDIEQQVIYRLDANEQDVLPLLKNVGIAAFIINMKIKIFMTGPGSEKTYRAEKEAKMLECHNL